MGESKFTCPICAREFPTQYKVKNPRSRGWHNRDKVYGTAQLMRLHAVNNFRKHVEACRKKHCWSCENSNEAPVLGMDGFHYHGRGRCKAYPHSRVNAGKNY
jgi:hypothetical protein